METLALLSVAQLGIRLKMLRDGFEWSALTLSDECACDESTIYRIEKGEFGPGYDLLVNLSIALQVPLWVLVKA